MTDREFYTKSIEVINWSPHSTEAGKKLYKRTIKDPQALAEAHAFFGTVQAVYDATTPTIVKFVQMYYGQKTRDEAETSLRHDRNESLRQKKRR